MHAGQIEPSLMQQCFQRLHANISMVGAEQTRQSALCKQDALVSWQLGPCRCSHAACPRLQKPPSPPSNFNDGLRLKLCAGQASELRGPPRDEVAAAPAEDNLEEASQEMLREETQALEALYSSGRVSCSSDQLQLQLPLQDVRCLVIAPSKVHPQALARCLNSEALQKIKGSMYARFLG